MRLEARVKEDVTKKVQSWRKAGPVVQGPLEAGKGQEGFSPPASEEAAITSISWRCLTSRTIR
jgi:hypothetical protein